MCCFFGLFDPDDEEMYVEELVVGLLADESVNIAAMPDALENDTFRCMSSCCSSICWR